ncbi:type VII secretion protein EccB [Rhodococcus sp. HNM0569]|uniref:type VII secretion protein EccB n=1 Tax=Rhodococcus sp. HNM0569 TaxID=2716340 RepID=UPI00146C894C|nr:type VII secretion protein EccB [Rhodococcus sp. HNM0569]NLU81759.1 type VII secretion protein EccB [Rhodococcus sp. HNM0569]
MASTPTTRWQVSGYRFLVRRMEHALVRRDVRMLHDPMRSQSRALVVGVVAASVGLAGCGVLALFKPQDKIGDASIVVGKESGAMYVAHQDTLRPVLNLASARLILGQADDAAVVSDSEIESRPRGALVGIPGAPSSLPEGGDSPWTVCDTVSGSGAGSVSSTSVLVGQPTLGSGDRMLAGSQSFLVENRGVSYLVHDGKKARIDMNDSVVTRALGIEGHEPRAVSTGLLNALPESAPIVPPQVPDRGEHPEFGQFGDRKIGSVVQSSDGQGTQYYVILRDGIQNIDRAAALILMNTASYGEETIPSVTPDATARAPQASQQLALDSFPSELPEIVDAKDSPVGCLSWKPLEKSESENADAAEVSLVAARSLPIGTDAHTVDLAQQDGAGDNADNVWVAPGSSGFVQSTGIEPNSTRRAATFFVADTGVRYGISDENQGEARKALGAPDSPALAPWPILDLLAPGPYLSKSAAERAHDGMSLDLDSVGMASGG